jgi:hypothetical protein
LRPFLVTRFDPHEKSPSLEQSSGGLFSIPRGVMAQRVLHVQKPSIAQLLRTASDELDRLIFEVERGIRGAEDYNHCEVQASVIAKNLRAAFRKGNV